VGELTLGRFAGGPSAMFDLFCFQDATVTMKCQYVVVVNTSLPMPDRHAMLPMSFSYLKTGMNSLYP
jgi:hypothetical protein